MYQKLTFLSILLAFLAGDSESQDVIIAKCEYTIIEPSNYACILKNLTVPRGGSIKIAGDHLPGHNSFDVMLVKIESSKFYEIPMEIFSTFSGLRIFEMTSDNSLEKLSDFQNCATLSNVKLNWLNLKEVPETTFQNCKNLVILDLARNKISQLSSNFLKNLINLQIFDISGNELQGIPENLFASLDKNLRVLSITDNKLQEIDDISIKGLSNLQILNLGGNQLTKAPEIFDNMANLNFLDLKSNKIPKFESADFKSLINLRQLSLSGNPIERLDDTLKYLKNLIWVEINGAELRNLSKESFQTNLKLNEISLRNNKILQIEIGTFENLPKLMHLDLTRNWCVNKDFIIANQDFEPVRKSLQNCYDGVLENNDVVMCKFEMRDEQYTCVVSNAIIQENQTVLVTGIHFPGKSDSDVLSVVFEESSLEKIPAEVFKTFSNLKHLKVSLTGLKKINPFKSCGNLDTFEAAQNLITDLDKVVFEECPNLQTLDLHDNQLTKVPDIFKNMQKLDMLDLSSNKIVEIDPNNFKNLGKLRELSLSFNPIQNLVESFKHLQNLERVDINGAELRNISKESFWGILNMKEIFLSGNQILHIESGSFEQLPNLEILNLKDNVCIDKEFLIVNQDFEPVRESLKNCYAGIPEGSEFLTCDFEMKDEYTCVVRNTTIQENQTVLVTGNHLPGKLNSDVLSVEFIYSDLEIIPLEIFRTFENMRELIVSVSGLKNINQLENCGNLETLKAGSNHLATLDKDVFQECPNLRSLDLAYNFLKEVPIFENMEKLEILDLRHNGIEEIDPECFKSLGNLRELLLSWNSIQDLGNSLKHLKNLEKFVLTTNFLRNISKESFSGILNLKQITLSENEIMRIERGSFEELHNLEILDLKDNVCIDKKLVIVNQDFEPVRESLKYCYAGIPEGSEFLTCDFEMKEEYTCVIRNVTIRENKKIAITGNHLPGKSNSDVLSVDFENSELEIIPLEIFRTFDNMRRLIVETTGLKRINQLESCWNLEYFKAGHNQIATVDKEVFQTCWNLQTLDLRDNQLTKVPEIFKNIQKLDSLNLSSNRIEEIDPENFKSLGNMRELLLSFNPIHALDDSLKYLTNLSRIDINGAELRNISKKSFQENLSLTEIYLGNNKILQIEIGTFENLPKLTHLDLTRNWCVNKEFFIENQDFEPVRKSLQNCYDGVMENSDALMCSFEMRDEQYTCVVSNTIILKNQSLFVTGSHLPGKSDTDVLSVVFEESSLEKIPAEIFKAFENLKTLNVDSTGLKEINPLKNCEKLEFLEAAHNQITLPDDGVFQKCSNLRSIDLSSNKIEKIPGKTFAGNSLLKSINLSKNVIVAIEPCQFLEDAGEFANLNLKENICIDADLWTTGGDLSQLKLRLRYCFGSWYFN